MNLEEAMDGGFNEEVTPPGIDQLNSSGVDLVKHRALRVKVLTRGYSRTRTTSFLALQRGEGIGIFQIPLIDKVSLRARCHRSPAIPLPLHKVVYQIQII